MTTNNSTTPAAVKLQDDHTALLERVDSILDAGDAAAKRTSAELHLLDRLKDADDLICVYANNSGSAKLSDVAEALYTASTKLIEQDDPTHRRVGYVLALDAFLASPDDLQRAIRKLRQHLVESAPALALPSDSAIAPRQEVPLAADYLINGYELRLESDGRLLGIGHELSFDQVLTLLCFFRMPGVAALVDDLAIEDQTVRELRWQEAQAQEMTREQAYELLTTDDVFMTRIAHEAARRGMAILGEQAAV